VSADGDILPGYRDVDGTWHRTDPAVVAECAAARPTLPRTGVRPPHFTRPDRRDDVGWATDLVLEDGSVISLGGTLPPGLPLGYHRLVASTGDAEQPLVVAPDRAVPLPVGGSGWAVQVPTLRVAGAEVGNLGSVARFASWATERGTSHLLVSPLHAPLPLTPRQPSPYSPSSRIWRDPLLIDPELLGRERAATQPGDDRADPDRVDRDRAWADLRPRLREAWDGLADRARDDFERWRTAHGSALEVFARHESLVDSLGASWPDWPDELQQPDAPAVAAHARAHADDVAFHAWLQWVVEAQLAAVGARTHLVTDLAVGVDPSGADAWVHRSLVARGVHLGAPPDTFNPAGQDWGLAAFDPAALRLAAYAPFVGALRANLRHAAAIRIDHVMGLFRIWWVPPGHPPDRGAYIRMPADDLVDLVCLEATRAGAAVIGEDLGTVEHEVRATMAERGLNGTRLVWFDDVPPSQLPRTCLASIGTHDLPTVAGLLRGADARERRDLGIAVDADDDASLLRRLHAACREGGGEDEPTDPVTTTARAVSALAAGPAALVLASLEDALGMTRRVNQPGTTGERPNWSIPLPMPVESLVEDAGVQLVGDALVENRSISDGTSASGTAGE
jgi:4-alpha-glucanotransferase